MERFPRRLGGLSVASTLPPLQHIPQPPSLRAFELTYWSEHCEFIAVVRARNEHAAAAEAVIELAVKCPDFDPDSARLARCVEVR